MVKSDSLQLIVLIGENAHYAAGKFAARLGAFTMSDGMRTTLKDRVYPSAYSQSQLTKALTRKRPKNVVLDSLESNMTPSYQKSAVHLVVKALDPNRTIVITTNSLMVIYQLNNELLSRSLLPAQVEVFDCRTGDPQLMNLCHGPDKWPHIDESIVGHHYDDMNAQYNRLINRWLEADRIKYDAPEGADSFSDYSDEFGRDV